MWEEHDTQNDSEDQSDPVIASLKQYSDHLKILLVAF
jgi:hypothetical protein